MYTYCPYQGGFQQSKISHRIDMNVWEIESILMAFVLRFFATENPLGPYSTNVSNCLHILTFIYLWHERYIGHWTRNNVNGIAAKNRTKKFRNQLVLEFWMIHNRATRNFLFYLFKWFFGGIKWFLPDQMAWQKISLWKWIHLF